MHLKLEREKRERQREETRHREGSEVEEGKYYITGQGILAVSVTQFPVIGCLP